MMTLEDLTGCLVVATGPGAAVLWNGDETLFMVDGLGLVVASHRPLALRSARVDAAIRPLVAKHAARRWLHGAGRESIAP